MASALALVFVLLASGYAARRSGRFPEQAADVLNRFVIDVCLPAAILRLVPSLSFSWDLIALALVPWILVAAAYAVTWLSARLLRFDRATRTTVFLCTALGNTSFLGFPLCQALLGEAALPLAAVYDQLGSFLVLCLVLPVALARATGEGTPRLGPMLRKVATFPPFIGLVLALLPVRHPAWLVAVLREIGDALVPTAIFAVGLRLRLTPPKQVSAFVAALASKLLLMPLCALGLAHLLGAPRDVLQVAVLESAMPPMITAGAALMAAGLAPELTAALVGWGIIVGVFSVSTWAFLLR